MAEAKADKSAKVVKKETGLALKFKKVRAQLWLFHGPKTSNKCSCCSSSCGGRSLLALPYLRQLSSSARSFSPSLICPC
jgi:hypothetical protein